MKMYKAISLLGLFGVVGNAYSVQMTPQIQSLLDQKAQKVAELEKCDKTRKGFMIAGISTLGLTAVGVGGNIALANKNKKLDAELTSKKSELNTKRQELSSLQSQRLRQQLSQMAQTAVDVQIVGTEQTDQAIIANFDNVELNADVDGLDVCYSAINGYDAGTRKNQCSRSANLQKGEWGVVFDGYEVYGKALCNTTKSTPGTATNDEQSTADGTSCWCKMTNKDGNELQLPWVFQDARDLPKDCRGYCASDCGLWVKGKASFRRAIYGQTAAVSSRAVDTDAIDAAQEEFNNGIVFTVQDTNGNIISNLHIECSGGEMTESQSVVNKDKVSINKALPDNAQCTISSTGYQTKTVTVGEIKSSGAVALVKQKSAIELCVESRNTPEGKACCYLPNGVAKWEGGACVCQAENTEFQIDKGVGKCVEKTQPAPNPAQTKLDPSVNGTGHCYKDIDGDNEYNEDCSKFNNMQPGDWGVVFPYGEVYGHAVCNDTGGRYGVASNDERYKTGGVNCWCKMTEPAVSRWVFYHSYLSASSCADLCAAICGANVQDFSGFRSGVFGSVAN